MEIKRFLLLIFAISASCCAYGFKEPKPLPTIDEVAGDYMEVHAEDRHWRLFSITMPPESKLADHQSGSRAIIPMTDIEIQRLEGSSELMTVPAYQALWLTNVESKGFRNASDSVLEYLVLESKNRSLELLEAPKECPSGTSLLSYDELLICLIKPEKEVEVCSDNDNWLYVPASGGELEFKLDGELLSRTERGVEILTKGKHKVLHKSKPLLLLNFNP